MKGQPVPDTPGAFQSHDQCAKFLPQRRPGPRSPMSAGDDRHRHPRCLIENDTQLAVNRQPDETSGLALTPLDHLSVIG